MGSISKQESNCYTPIHKHDCHCCTYLGAFKEHDLYHCKQDGEIPTIIARFGSDEPDYKSGSVARSSGVVFSVRINLHHGREVIRSWNIPL